MRQRRKMGGRVAKEKGREDTEGGREEGRRLELGIIRGETRCCCCWLCCSSSSPCFCVPKYSRRRRTPFLQPRFLLERIFPACSSSGKEERGQSEAKSAWQVSGEGDLCKTRREEEEEPSSEGERRKRSGERPHTANPSAAFPRPVK